MQGRRLLTITVVIWHVFVLGSLAYQLGVIRPTRGMFLRKELWAPLSNWVRLGNFFQFKTSRAAAVFFLVLLATGILVLMVYLARPATGWVLMFLWNVLGAMNFFPSSATERNLETLVTLSMSFAAMAVATVLARPRQPC